jgi:phospholipase C
MDRALSQIETVVVLMLENRSLDNVLGWLYHDEAPAHVFPLDSLERFDGIPAWASNRSGDREYTPAKGTSGFPEPLRVTNTSSYNSAPTVTARCRKSPGTTNHG